MKNIATLYITIAASALVLSSCSGRRYDHPRVRVEAKDLKTARVEEKPVTTEPTTAVLLKKENEVRKMETPVVASNEKEVISPVGHESLVKEQPQQETGKKPIIDLTSFTKKMKEHNHIFKVKDVQKTQLLGWILGMILLFVGFVIFIALALIFLYVISSFVPYTVFLIIAIVLGVAAVLFLILGLADVFTPGV
jgi:hypothetical protein